MAHAGNPLKQKSQIINKTITTPGKESEFKDSPGINHPLYTEQLDDWMKVEDAYVGQKRVMAKIGHYLPQEALENEKVYKNRVSHALWFGATKQVTKAYIGAVYRKKPAHNIEEDSAFLAPLINNLDRQGTHHITMGKQGLLNMLKRGHTFLLNDMPKALISPDGKIKIPTKGDVEKLELRPFMQSIDPVYVPNWRVEMSRKSGIDTLVLFVREFTILRARGKFGHTLISIRLVYELDGWTLYEKQKDAEGKEDWVKVGEGQIVIRGKPLDFIPVKTIYVNKIAAMHSELPILDFSNENFRYFSIDSDRRFSSHMTAYPIGIFPGVRKDEIIDEQDGKQFGIGPFVALCLKNADSKPYWMETKGIAPGILESELETSESKMAKYTLRLFSTKSESANRPLGETKLNAAAENSILQSMAIDLGMGMEEGLQTMEDWGSSNPKKISYKLNNDYTALTMDPSLLDRLSDMVDKEQLPLESLWKLMREWEINLPPDKELFEQFMNQSRLFFTGGSANGNSEENGNVQSNREREKREIANRARADEAARGIN